MIDIGGSRGSKSLAILKRHPRLKAPVVDRELLARLEFQPGDIPQSAPPARSDKDIYFLSAVLHGFDNDTCAELVQEVG